MQIPQDWELIGFFEAEPTLLHEEDSEHGWEYNILTFRTKRGEDAITCELDPGYSALKLDWSRSDNMRVRLELCFADKLAVYSQDGREWMRVDFEPDKYILPFVLQLKPTVQVDWGVTRWL